MRGKPHTVIYRRAQPGITPADAGKTASITLRIAENQDHPRGCGENAKNMRFIPITSGSPPRMRGKHPFEGMDEEAVRITPADAGKTP